MNKDLISRKALLEAMDNVEELMEEAMCIPSWASAKKCARTVKPVDAVEVVRCKDCIYYDKDIIPAYCKLHTDKVGYCDESVYMSENDFCSYGAKMDGDKND